VIRLQNAIFLQKAICLQKVVCLQRAIWLAKGVGNNFSYYQSISGSVEKNCFSGNNYQQSARRTVNENCSGSLAIKNDKFAENPFLFFISIPMSK